MALRERARSPTKNDPTAADLQLPLEVLIQSRKWVATIRRIQIAPLEPEKELKVITIGGFQSSSGMTPLHYACERTPPLPVIQALIESYPMACLTRCMPGGALPIHIACTWHCSYPVIEALLTADQGGVEVKDELGNLPIHSACFSGADDSVIRLLLSIAPATIFARNHQGSRPVDICQRLRHDNRAAVLTFLLNFKDDQQRKHQRKSSSGNWGDVAARAAALNGNGLDLPVDTAVGNDSGSEVEVALTKKSNEEDLNWI